MIWLAVAIVMAAAILAWGNSRRRLGGLTHDDRNWIAGQIAEQVQLPMMDQFRAVHQRLDHHETRLKELER